MTVTALNKHPSFAIRTQIRVMEEFRKMSSDMKAHQILVLLHIFKTPGITGVEIARLISVSEAAISRTAYLLSEYDKYNDKPGHGLIEQRVDPMDGRKKQYFPTPKGLRVRDTLVHLLEK